MFTIWIRRPWQRQKCIKFCSISLIDSGDCASKNRDVLKMNIWNNIVFCCKSCIRRMAFWIDWIRECAWEVERNLRYVTVNKNMAVNVNFRKYCTTNHIHIVANAQYIESVLCLIMNTIVYLAVCAFSAEEPINGGGLHSKGSCSIDSLSY